MQVDVMLAAEGRAAQTACLLLLNDAAPVLGSFFACHEPAPFHKIS